MNNTAQHQHSAEAGTPGNSGGSGGVDAAVLAAIRGAMSRGRLQVPTQASKVYKDECCFCFDNVYSDCGVFVNLETMLGVGAPYLGMDAKKTGNVLYLHQKWEQIPKQPQQLDNKAEVSSSDEPSKLAVGVEGGFLVEEQFQLVKTYSLYVVVEGGRPALVPLPEPALPEFLSRVCEAVIAHPGMRAVAQADSWALSQDLQPSKYAAHLVQLDSGKKISNDPASWRDEATGDTNNLWLNLSTGYIGGGRKNWDGSGGSGSALQHYKETGELYPLCVKLGTITPSGADVWSYAADEDTLVVDPLLGEHLAHWGIDVMRLEKTDKSFSELEVELNLTHDWSRIVAGDDALEPVTGPGLKGLRNLGSSCYLNAVMQVLLALPEVQERYLKLPRESALIAADPVNDLTVQLGKLATGLLTGKYIEPATSAPPLPYTLEKYVVAPLMFKTLVGRGHREFSSSRQQDASEFFQYFLELLDKEEKQSVGRYHLGGTGRTAELFEFTMEQRMQCQKTHQVRYTAGDQTLENLLELRIPPEQIITTAAAAGGEVSAGDDEKDAKKQRVESVSFEACLDDYFAPRLVDFAHPDPTVGRSSAVQTQRFRTFPRYLMVKLGRYYVDSQWRQVKIDAKVPVPEYLDLRDYRGNGLQDKELPMQSGAESAGSDQAAAPAVDESVVAQLVAMGFSENGSRRAALAVKNDCEAAVGWVFDHAEDADFDLPLPTSAPAVGGTGTGSKPSFSQDELVMLISFGYTRQQALAALTACDGNVERAADWLFSHEGNLDEAVTQILGVAMDTEGSASAGSGVASEDGEGRYTLQAVISHLGRSTDHGHYVCHLRQRDGGWALFNDDKVCRAKTAPLEHGFMYLYRRDYAPAAQQS